MSVSQKIAVDVEFVPPGTSAVVAPGRLFVDVGNGFGPGVLDHHAPGTPGECAARLVLDHTDYVLSQAGASGRVTVVTHRYPDMDAISGVYFVNALLTGVTIDVAAREWADYVCGVDRGDTRLDPARPLNPYSVLMMRLSRAGEAAEKADEISRMMLDDGLDFVDTMLTRVRQGYSLREPAIVEQLPSLSGDVAAVLADHAAYLRDVERAERFLCPLPLDDGAGVAPVPGIWVRQPESELFKSWARGDVRDGSRPRGYVFTGVQISAERAILSVAPDSGVTLLGLGEALESAEQAKRQQLGRPRTGPVREGFDSPDPWYDGRSALHGYTIVDAPRDGTVLSPEEIGRTFDEYLGEIKKTRLWQIG